MTVAQFKPGDRVLVEFGGTRTAVVDYIGASSVGVLIDLPDGEPVRGIYREHEITRCKE